MSTRTMAQVEQRVSPASGPAFGRTRRPVVFLQDVAEYPTRSVLGHDFARVSVQPKAQSVQPGMESCPLGLAAPHYCPFGGACHTCPASAVQAKLIINEPGDKYEQEADRIADQVMRMPDPGPPDVQRSCHDCDEELQRQVEPEEEEEEESLQTKPLIPGRPASEVGGIEVPLVVHEVLSSPGRPLEPSFRQHMEARFGIDFSQVRVHTDAKAADSARAVNSLAYTVGCDIVMGAGQYAPATTHGRRLVAHELAHTLQQSPGGTTSAVGAIAGSKPGNAGERRAEEHATSVVSGDETTVPPAQTHSHTLTLQRLGDLTQVPAGMRCPIATDRPAGGVDIRFPESVATLSPAQKASVASFVGSWHAGGANAGVRIDGYASVEGSQPFNWRLSCNRAFAVRNEMVSPSTVGVTGIPAGSITVFAHGETNEFSTDLAPNRRAVMTTTIPASRVPAPTPAPPPAPESTPEQPVARGRRICGDVEEFIRSTLGIDRTIITDLVTCLCFAGGLLDLVDTLFPPAAPYVEGFDCTCNIMTALQEIYNRGADGGCWSWSNLTSTDILLITGLIELTIADCGSLPIGTALGGLIAGAGGATGGTAAAPGPGTIAGGVGGIAAGTVLGDFIIDIAAMALQNLITQGTVWPVNQCGACARLAQALGLGIDPQAVCSSAFPAP